MAMYNPQEEYERTVLCYQESEGNYKLVSTEWQRNTYPGFLKEKIYCQNLTFLIKIN